MTTPPDPFAALSLAPDPGLSDDAVRTAWRRIAAATHPDRADGGDPGAYRAASAAYTVLRTTWGRAEAYADLTTGSPVQPPPADAAGRQPVSPWRDLALVPVRIWRGSRCAWPCASPPPWYWVSRRRGRAPGPRRSRAW